MKTIAVIPARGGSKGVPRKNILEVAGIPLLAYSILAAQNSNYVERVIVTTDDDEIGLISKEYGAEVIMRPAELSDDTIMPDASIVHVLETLAEQGYIPDCIVFLQPTSPIRYKDDIDNALDIFFNNEVDTVFSGVDIHPFFWRKNGDTLLPVNFNPKARKGRQELDQEIIENGSIYISKASNYIKYKDRFGEKVMTYLMSNHTLFEIDEKSDFLLVESLMISMLKQGDNIVRMERE